MFLRCTLFMTPFVEPGTWSKIASSIWDHEGTNIKKSGRPEYDFVTHFERSSLFQILTWMESSEKGWPLQVHRSLFCRVPPDQRLTMKALFTNSDMSLRSSLEGHKEIVNELLSRSTRSVSPAISFAKKRIGVRWGCRGVNLGEMD